MLYLAILFLKFFTSNRPSQNICGGRLTNRPYVQTDAHGRNHTHTHAITRTRTQTHAHAHSLRMHTHTHKHTLEACSAPVLHTNPYTHTHTRTHTLAHTSVHKLIHSQNVVHCFSHGALQYDQVIGAPVAHIFVVWPSFCGSSMGRCLGGKGSEGCCKRRGGFHTTRAGPPNPNSWCNMKPCLRIMNCPRCLGRHCETTGWWWTWRRSHARN